YETAGENAHGRCSLAGFPARLRPRPPRAGRARALPSRPWAPRRLARRPGGSAGGLGARALGPPRRRPRLDRGRLGPAPATGLGLGGAAVGVERWQLAVAGGALGPALLRGRSLEIVAARLNAR